MNFSFFFFSFLIFLFDFERFCVFCWLVRSCWIFNISPMLYPCLCTYAQLRSGTKRHFLETLSSRVSVRARHAVRCMREHITAHHTHKTSKNDRIVHYTRGRGLPLADGATLNFYARISQGFGGPQRQKSIWKLCSMYLHIKGTQSDTSRAENCPPAHQTHTHTHNRIRP